MIEDTQQVTVIVNIVGKFFVIKRNARTLRQTFTLRGHRVCCVLNNKLVEAFQDALGMLGSEHPAIFRCAINQTIVITQVSATVVNTQFQGAARVDFHLR